MFRWLGRLVTKYAPVIIISVLIISIFFTLVIPKIEFKTKLNSFLPDNDLVRANRRVDSYFGDEYVAHLILVEADNAAHDVLTPAALREQYDIYQRCTNKANVVGVLSIVSVFDQVFSKIYPENYTTFNELTDDQIENAKELIFNIMKNPEEIVLLNLYLNLTPGLTLNDLQQVIDLFFDKNFDYLSPVSKASKTLIIVILDGNLSGHVINQLSRNIKETINSDDSDKYQQVKLRHTSAPLINTDLDEESEKSFINLGVVIFILIALILFLSFRRISYVIIPLVTLALAVLWTFGTMVLLEIEFTIITVAIIPLIIGLGVDYSVYISKRYQEELRAGQDISSAISSSVGSVGTAMFLAVVTTIIAFMSNLTSEIQPIREFGLVCGLGILYAFILTLTFHTSVRWLVDMKSSKNPVIGKEKELYVVDVGTKTASHGVLYYPVLVLIIVVVITVGALNFGLKIRTEFNNNDFLPNSWDSIQTQEKLRDDFNGSSFTRSYILIEDSIENNYTSLATLSTLFDLQMVKDNIANDKYVVRVSGVPRIECILDYVQEAIHSNSTLSALVDKDLDLFPDNDAAVVTVFDYLYSQKDIDNTDKGLQNILSSGTSIDELLYRDSAGNYRATVILVYVNAVSSGEVREMYSELKSDIAPANFGSMSKIVTGGAILTVTTMDALQESQIWSTAVSMIFALVILIIIYRSITLGIIALVPVLISSVWILGTMFLLGISINVFTVSITALTIGLGIDYAIHIIERFREERKKNRPQQAISKTIQNTGAALFISGITTVCGFIVLIISQIPPIQHFGIITAMTIIYSAILAMVVIPILLLRTDGKRI